ncbi:MAG: MBL fold metallo-hydrolase [Hyphomicrobiaceae bacterium]|nr:MBL fold metallo-hydrolase [Hyphomicrobiaceae bacterium]
MAERAAARHPDPSGTNPGDGDTLTFRILGCGSSGGVPRIGHEWGQCDPAEPRNRRTRCSLLVTRRKPTGERTIVLVDTGPDLRQQLLDTDADRLDAVLYTHAHADHIHGIDDLRAMVLRHRKRVDVYMDEPTSARAHEAFGYCFRTPAGSSYPPILTEHRLIAGMAVTIHGPGGPIRALPIRQTHGEIDSLGFRFGPVGYSPDISGLPVESAMVLDNLDVWIVDALRWTPHVSHFGVYQAIEVAHSLQPRPKRVILTHMHVDLDYADLKAQLPAGFEPAHDGLEFTVPVLA